MDFLTDSIEWVRHGNHGLVFAGAAFIAFALLTAFASVVFWSREAIRARRPGGRSAMSSVCSPGDVDKAGSLDGRRSSTRRHGPGHRVARLRGQIRRLSLSNGMLLFLTRWVSGPLKIGSVAPSSRGLARAMAAQLPEEYGLCVELGGGTGSLTRSLLAAGVPEESLIVLERDPRLAAYLRRKFPRLRIVHGDAGDLTRILGDQGIESVDAVFSSLPLRSMPRRVRGRIIAESFAALDEDGLFIQYTYGLEPPVPGDVCDDLSLKGSAAARVWQNLPPATVWRYCRAA